MAFEKATRKNVKVVVGISGYTGSGKTKSALEIATGLVAKSGGKIAMICTENGRGAMYSEDYSYDYEQIWAPYTPERYISKINESAQSGHNVLIIDNFSHAWEGDGGMVEFSDSSDNPGKGIGKWLAPKMRWKRLANALLQIHQGHIIVCMRTKVLWETEKYKDSGGMEKTRQKMVGQVPVVEKNFPYELTVSLLMNPDHTHTILKNNQHLDPIFMASKMPTAEMGRGMIEWINGGKAKSAAELRLNKLAATAVQYAQQGMKEYEIYFKGLTQEERVLLKDRHEGFKHTAKEIDSAKREEEPIPDVNADHPGTASGLFNDTDPVYDPATDGSKMPNVVPAPPKEQAD